ncbi:MAG: hypothetical protein ACREFD_11135, partial [Stellaceae bacterium]
SRRAASLGGVGGSTCEMFPVEPPHLRAASTYRENALTAMAWRISTAIVRIGVPEVQANRQTARKTAAAAVWWALPTRPQSRENRGFGVKLLQFGNNAGKSS